VPRDPVFLYGHLFNTILSGSLMTSTRKALYPIAISTLVNFGIALLCLKYHGISAFLGYLTGTIASATLSFLWFLGALRGMRSNILVLLALTLAGFILRVVILAIFALGGYFILRMNYTFFTISFLAGTIVSLIVEVWFFNTARQSEKKM
jgi:hypothetical protein